MVIRRDIDEEGHVEAEGDRSHLMVVQSRPSSTILGSLTLI